MSQVRADLTVSMTAYFTEEECGTSRHQHASHSKDWALVKWTSWSHQRPCPARLELLAIRTEKDIWQVSGWHTACCKFQQQLVIFTFSVCLFLVLLWSQQPWHWWRCQLRRPTIQHHDGARQWRTADAAAAGCGSQVRQQLATRVAYLLWCTQTSAHSGCWAGKLNRRAALLHGAGTQGAQ
jgi:hypothetical protein